MAQPLSCVRCRKRKIKCNRVHPCVHCQSAGVECSIPSRRARVSRPKDSRARKDELLRRIKQLESIVGRAIAPVQPAKDSSDGASEACIAPSPPHVVPNGDTGHETHENDDLGDQYASFIEHRNGSAARPVGDIWAKLAYAFGDLRELLEERAESDEDDGHADFFDSPSNTEGSGLFNPQIDLELLRESYPSDGQRAVLFEAYFANVHPLCCILHKPTAKTHFYGMTQFVQPATGRIKLPSLEAVSFAMYFIAVVSMTPEDCSALLGEERSDLIVRYQRCTEAVLSHADFVNSLELMTLQAFVLYIFALRSSTDPRSGWALVALAIRIAHGINLHRDREGVKFCTFEAQMRRRLWWSILSLDMRVAEDRASEPIVLPHSFTTVMPMNINDEDIDIKQSAPLMERKGITDVSGSLVIMDALNTARGIGFIRTPLPNDTQTVEEKEDLVRQCKDRIEKLYLGGPESIDPRTSVIRTMGQIMVLKLFLMLRYPLQAIKPTIPHYDREQVIRNALGHLKLSAELQRSDAGARFAWLLDAHVPWHAVAVIVAEMRPRSEDPIADEVWTIIDGNYQRWNERAKTMKETAIWRPLQRLLCRARTQMRQLVKQRLRLASNEGSSVQSHQNSDLQLPPDMWANSPDVLNSLDLEPSKSGGSVVPIEWDKWNDFINDFETQSLPNIDEWQYS